MRLLMVIMSFWWTLGAQGQEGVATEQQLEQLAEEEEIEDGPEGWLEALEHLRRHPLDINKATEEDLQQLHVLHPLQIFHLLQYRRLLGPLLHVYELQSVPLWDPGTIRKLLPFITIETSAPVPFRKMLVSGSHRFSMAWSTQLQTAAGYTKNNADYFAGGKARLLFRYRFSFHNGVRWGYTAEKDAGEPVSKTVFDFHSFHFFWKRSGWLRTVALGDFAINMGQGLVHWQSLAFKKSHEVLSIRRQAPVILPYQSSGEFYFQRGIAVGLEKNKISAHLFFSNRAMDADAGTDTAGKPGFSTFDISGLHRTKAEQADRASVRWISFGGTLHYRQKGYRIGINAVRHLFSIPMQEANAPYRQFSISGDGWMNASIDYNATVKNLHFFGELAMDRSPKPALLHGVLVSLDKKVDLSLLQRWIAKDYQSLLGNAFTEQRMPSNEHGCYAGLRLRPTAQWQVEAYYDLFRFPWLRFRADAPGYGNEHLLQVQYQPNRQTTISLQYKSEKKPFNEMMQQGVLKRIVTKEKSGFRLQASMQLSRRFHFRTRMDAAIYREEGGLPEHGFLVYAEGACQASLRTSVQLRLQFFETEGFNSRIYAYESDVYGFSIPALYDKGFRFFLNLRYHLSPPLSFWFRFVQTVYHNRVASGSGLNLIKGNTVSEVKIQASYRF